MLLPSLRGAPRQATIARLEIFRLKVNARGNWIIARLTTDSGVQGIGDASQGGADEDVAAYLDRFFQLLKGRSVHDIEWLRQAAEPEIAQDGLRAAVAQSALEQCLWDIRGKLFGVPVYDLLGGRVQQKIRNYANINRSTDPRTPEGFARMAERAIAAGFDAVKLAPFDDMPHDLSDRGRIEEFTKLGIARVAAVRQAIGSNNDLLVDVHSHLDVERGIDLAHRLEPLNLFWLEEITPANPVANLAAVHRAAKMPIAGGELIHGVKGFYPYIAGNAVDIVMPDPKYCGGPLEMKKIAALAEAAKLKVSPHGPASPVGNVVSAHVGSTMPNFLILELSYGEVPWRADLIDPPERITKSCLPLTDRPGFGISLNEKTVAKYRIV